MDVYAARHKNKDILMNSSTGGMFTAFSDVILVNSGAVVSAVYNYETNQTEYQLYTDKTTRDEARGSKYMQSIPLDVFKESEKWLKNNSGNLLFVGMGCQADGFRKFVELKGVSNRAVIVDIICHGSPSPKLWREYIGRKIDYVAFKDKRNGWKNPTALIVENGKEKSISDYVTIFYNKCALRPSCHECPYTTIERKVDITIGDYWGIDEKIPDFYSEKGNALVLVHTEKGERLWNLVKDNLDWVESNTTDCLQTNLIRPTEKSLLREQFWRDYQKGGIQFIMKKYGQVNFAAKIKSKMKKFFGGGKTNLSNRRLWRAELC
jgi:coenzyme F420-reducing hydrogenase beta subunit